MAEKEYIERNELISNLKYFAPEYYSGLINSLIIKQPAADVVPVKHGHYIDKTEWNTRLGLGLCRYECSVCYAKIPHKPNTSQLYRDNYCPNCGARMDGKDGESNG